MIPKIDRLKNFKKEDDCLISPSGLIIRSTMYGGLYVEKSDLCSSKKFKEQGKQLSEVLKRIKGRNKK